MPAGERKSNQGGIEALRNDLRRADTTHLISCEFNMNTAWVELKSADGRMISIDTIAVENEVADNMYQRSELDWLIYNKPLEYAQLVLDGNLERYVKGTPEHRLID